MIIEKRCFMQTKMTIGEHNHTSDHILDWLEDSISFLPSFFNDTYTSDDISSYQLWGQADQESDHNLISNYVISLDTNTTPSPTNTTSLTPINPPIPDHPPSSSSSKKRKNQSQADEDVSFQAVKKPAGNKKSTNKSTISNCNNSKEGRWAEQLLNPCATAISAGNLTRVQHLLYVLHELQSLTGDANHRLAAHGLKALAYHLSSSSSSLGPGTFACTEPRFFQRSLIRFYEVSPWFSFPNTIANSSILQILAQEPDNARNLHILDIGVSHGVQWPTLLEALSRRSGGPPSLVRITVVAPTIENNQSTEPPFSVSPPGDNFVSRLLQFAKSMNMNLHINIVDNHPLKNLNAQIINTCPDENLVICAQFRLHHLNHNSPDERTEFLKVLRSWEPKGVILTENNMECSCTNCGDFAAGFSRKVDYLWKFLDSTSSAFKGREREERRAIEGEAARALISKGEMNEGKEKWCERMKGAGFFGEVFGEDAIDGGRALLRKYDNNWDMKVEDKNECVGLWWKGQPVSFCSLWRPDKKADQN